MRDRQAKWDRRFLALAEFVSGWSKDCSTRVGAVIAAPDLSVVSVGFNGFARGVSDDPERYADREVKYKLIVHAERNAMLFARRDLTGCTLYTHPFAPCSQCAAMVIQAGIRRCVSPPLPVELRERWAADCELARTSLREAGVVVDEI